MVSAISGPGLSSADFVSANRSDPEARDRQGLRPAGDSEPQDGANSPDGLTADERRVVAELRQIDGRVRAHEQAHLAAGAGLVRGVSFTFVTGPDGRQYAVGGEVSIDTSPANDPQATIRKAKQIRRAANAPADPSTQDRAVAAQASRMEQAARLELAEERRAELEEQHRTSQVQAFHQSGSSPAGSRFSLTA